MLDETALFLGSGDGAISDRSSPLATGLASDLATELGGGVAPACAPVVASTLKRSGAKAVISSAGVWPSTTLSTSSAVTSASPTPAPSCPVA